MALASVPPARGLVSWDVMNAVLLLILALGYFTAGGTVIAAFVGWRADGGRLVVVVRRWSPTYAWTAVGVAVAVALIAAGMRGGTRA